MAGVLSRHDPVAITGTLPKVCHAEGMTRFPYATGVRIFEYPRRATTLRERAASVAAETGVAIARTAKGHARKEVAVAEVLARRGG